MVILTAIYLLSKPDYSDDASKYNLANIDKIGKPEGTEVNYPLGWAQACNTPFRFWKQDAHSEGGTHNPMILFYPKGITDKGGLRNQYSYMYRYTSNNIRYCWY